MRKYTALASSLLALAAAPAFAGGYVAPVVDVEPVVAVTPAPIVGTWTGGYLGANVNYGKVKSLSMGDSETFPLGEDEFVTIPALLSTKPDGGSAALRGGYDWQRGNGVFGIGAEYNFGKYKDDVSLSYGAPTFTDIDGEPIDAPADFDIDDYLSDAPPAGAYGTARLKNVGTIFLRAGYAFNEQTMAYGLLGYSHGKAEIEGTIPGATASSSWSETVKGPTVGIGAEHRFNENWSGYAEYAHTNFGRVGDLDQKLKLDQVKLGVNFRF